MNKEIKLPIGSEAIRDSRYPVHRIADKLLPYLRILVEKFQPEQVILFGSYAYGNPTEDSDIDLLVIKSVKTSSRAEATAIRKALQPLRREGANLPLDILVRDPQDLAKRLREGADFHSDIYTHGVRLV
jgi:uncharacterized protein